MKNPKLCKIWKEHPPFISLPLPATLVGKKVSTSCLKLKLPPPPIFHFWILYGRFQLRQAVSVFQIEVLHRQCDILWHCCFEDKIGHWDIPEATQQMRAKQSNEDNDTTSSNNHKYKFYCCSTLVSLSTKQVLFCDSNLQLLGEPILCIKPRCILCICWGCLQVSCSDVFCMFLLPF